jgi:hypothetical protein
MKHALNVFDAKQGASTKATRLPHRKEPKRIRPQILIAKRFVEGLQTVPAVARTGYACSLLALETALIGLGALVLYLLWLLLLAAVAT